MVEATLLERFIVEIKAPEHIDCEGGVAVAIGFGLTVMVPVAFTLEQPPDKGML